MHTARSTPTYLSLVVIAIAACSPEHGPAITQPLAPSVNLSRGVQYSVTGGGIVDFTTAGVGVGYFSFNAIRKGDGSVEGRFHQRRETGATVVDFSGIVTCVTIDPVLRRARIGGIVTENRSTNPGFLTENHEVGDDVWFRVQDGDKEAGTVDASTSYGFKPTLVNTSAEYCALPFTGLPWWNPASTFTLRSGSIQIHP
jgi:hypothetical protein